MAGCGNGEELFYTNCCHLWLQTAIVLHPNSHTIVCIHHRGRQRLTPTTIHRRYGMPRVVHSCTETSRSILSVGTYTYWIEIGKRQSITYVYKDACSLYGPLQSIGSSTNWDKNPVTQQNNTQSQLCCQFRLREVSCVFHVCKYQIICTTSTWKYRFQKWREVHEPTEGNLCTAVQGTRGTAQKKAAAT